MMRRYAIYSDGKTSDCLCRFASDDALGAVMSDPTLSGCFRRVTRTRAREMFPAAFRPCEYVTTKTYGEFADVLTKVSDGANLWVRSPERSMDCFV